MRNDGKFKTRSQQHESFSQLVEKEGHEVNFCHVILEAQGSTFNNLIAAVTTVRVSQSP